MKDIGTGIVIGAVLAAIGFGAWNYWKSSPIQSALQQPAKELAKEEPKNIDCGKQGIAAYSPKAKKKLDLPDTVKRDPDKHVVAASKVPASEYPHTMTAVYDSGTGAVDMYLRQDPLPWLAFDRRGALGVAYGFRNEADGFVTRVYGRLDLVQIKRVHAGLLGDVDNAGNWYGGAFAEYRF